MLPLPLRPDRASYRLHLRPMDGGHAWSPACQLPGYDGAADAGALHAPLECASEEPGADADGGGGS